MDTRHLQHTLQKAQAYACLIQDSEGYWNGEVGGNATMEAEMIMLNYFLGIDDPEQQQKLVARILELQQDDGSWGMYYDAPGELSTTIECYFALKLARVNQSLKMQQAQAFICARGGVVKARLFTKVWLALFGQWSWDQLPLIPPEMIFLPSWFPVNIYEFAAWARTVVVPLSILFAQKPVIKIDNSQSIKELILPKTPNHAVPANKIDKQKNINNKEIKAWQKLKNVFSWAGLFTAINSVLKLYDKLPYQPGRASAIKKAINWLLMRQEADGTWAGLQPAWIYTLLALKSYGYKLSDTVIQHALAGIAKNYSIDTGKTIHIQVTNSPIWDTALMITGLFYIPSSLSHHNQFPLISQKNPLNNTDSDHFVRSQANKNKFSYTTPQIQNAIQWLIDNQILSGGDWQNKVKNVMPAAWAFQFADSHYPDIDDTAIVLIALHWYQKSDNKDASIQNIINKSIQWLLAMQSRNGGWAALDKNNDRSFVSKLAFFDFGEVVDPPSVDVTAHVLEALGYCGYREDHPAIKRGLAFIFQEQEADGSWFGRWGVNYIYGTSAVLVALKALHIPMSGSKIKRAIDWLIQKQNPDGGWGESCASYMSQQDRGKGVSTASQTAWALLGLIAAGLWNHSAVTHGIDYLNNSQNSHGTWDEPQYTGCGFPGYLVGKQIKNVQHINYQGTELSAGFLFRFSLYRHYWPLQALGRYYTELLHHQGYAASEVISEIRHAPSFTSSDQL